MNEQTKIDWLSMTEAARFLGINYQTLRKWVQAGEYGLCAYDIGGWKIKKSDLDAFLESRKVCLK